MRYIIFFLSIFSYQTLFGWCTGRIQGTVKDSITGNPLKEVNVVIRNTTIQTKTGTSGEYFFYQLSCDEAEYEIVATIAGYKTKSKKINVSPGSHIVIDFNLIPTRIQKGDIVTGNSKNIELWEHTAIFTDVIDKKELTKHNFETAGDAIKWFTGMQTQRGIYGTSSVCRCRGLEPEHLLVLLDGQRTSGEYDLNQYPVGMIERIEVLKGPYANLYGEGAIAGVVNIISTLPCNTNFAEITRGTYNTKVHTLRQGVKKDKFGYVVNYTQRSSDGIYPVFDKFDASDYRGQLIANLSEEEPKTISELTIEPGYYYRKDEYQSREHWKYNLNSIWDVKLHEFAEMKTRLSTYQYKQSYVYGRKISEIAGITEGEIYYTRLILKDMNHNISHSSSMGYSFIYSGYNSDASVDTSTLVHSLYLQHEIQSSSFTVLISDRIDTYYKDATLMPKIAILYGVDEPLKIRAGLGKSIREPDMSQLYYNESYTHNKGGVYVRSNDSLTAEKSITYELGAEYTGTNVLSARVSLFRYEIKNMIELYTVTENYHDGFPLRSYRNVPNAHIHGAELDLLAQPLNWLSGEIKYTFINTKNELTGVSLPDNIPHKSAIGLYIVEPKFKNRINLEAEYVGSADINGYFSNYMLNMKISRDITGYAHLFIAANNILNKKYAGYDDIIAAEWFGGINISF
ncbi:MAG: TonB-dependent receptor [bacterium]|nr:TonB-dependent receptor [bacterium]